VIDLFDSIYSGYPIGVLLLARRDDERPAKVTFGPVVVAAQTARHSYFLVDGQQRVTALVAALHHPDVRPRSGVFAVWFDLEARLLLRWWVWRGALSKQHSSSSQGYISRLQRLIKGGDDDIVAQAILRDAPDRVSLPTAWLPWNPKNAEVRICMGALLAHASLPDSAQLPIDEFADDDDAIATPEGAASDWLFLGPDRKRPTVVSEALVLGDLDTIDLTAAHARFPTMGHRAGSPTCSRRGPSDTH